MEVENAMKNWKTTTDKGVKRGSKAPEVSTDESESDLEDQIDPEVEILDIIDVEF